MKVFWLINWPFILLLCPVAHAQHDTFAQNQHSVWQTYIPTRNPLLPAADASKPYIYTNGDLDPPSMPKFPPGGYIGYGLDMTQASPLNIESVRGVDLPMQVSTDIILGR